MTAGDVGIEVLDDANDTTRFGRMAIGGDRHEVDLDVHRNGPRQVRHEHEGPPQYPDHQRMQSGVVGGDAFPESRHDFGEFGGTHHHRTKFGKSTVVSERHGSETLAARRLRRAECARAVPDHQQTNGEPGERAGSLFGTLAPVTADLPEAHWDRIDVDVVRDVSWLAVSWVGQHYAWRFEPNRDTVGLINRHLVANYGERSKNLRGLALVCGDMAAEKGYFETRDGVEYASITGIDLSGESLKRATDLMAGLPFHGLLADANRLDLDPGSLDFAVGLHGVHHIHNLGNAFFQLNQALAPDGLLFLYEWIGPPFLQIPRRNAFVTRLLLLLFNTKQRTTHLGEKKGSFLQYPPERFDPSEACNSDRLAPELEHHFEIIHQVRFGSLLYPLLDGNAPNVDMTKWSVGHRVRFALRVERVLTRLRLVRPLFCMTLAKPRPISR